MLESSRDSVSAESPAQSLRNSQAESVPQPEDYPIGSPASVQASCGSGSLSDSQSGVLAGAVLVSRVGGSCLFAETVPPQTPIRGRRFKIRVW